MSTSNSNPSPAQALSTFRTHFLQTSNFIHPSLELIYSPQAGVTLRVRSDLVGVFPKGEVAISCRHSASLSALNAWDGIGGVRVENGNGDDDAVGRDGDVDGGKSQSNDSGNVTVQGEGEVKVKSRKKLELPAELRQNARPQFIAAVWIAVQYLLGEESRWARYFDILPGLPEGGETTSNPSPQHNTPRPKRGLGEIDTPLWWTEEERSWLTNTNLAKGIVDLEGVWEVEWKRWKGVVSVWGKEMGVGVTWHHTKYALTLLGSRAFSSAQTLANLRKPFLDIYNPDMVLYPGVDSLNHNPFTQNSWRNDDEGFGIVVGDELAAGMEVWNPYGGKGNGELLLSYGFCLEDNPCDSFAIKLPPTLPPLLRLVQQAHQNGSASTSAISSTNTSASQPPLATTMISPLTPHNRPPAHNLTHNTFFIRHYSRHGWHELDYPHPQPEPPSTTNATSTNLNTPPAALSNALAGFPTLLLTTLAATLVIPHEATLVSSNPEHFSPEVLYTQLGMRNRIALINLLAQRLRVEVGRLPLPLPLPSMSEANRNAHGNEMEEGTGMMNADVDVAGNGENDNESESKKLRKHWTNIYLTSQRQILESNIEVLEAGLLSVLTPPPSTSTSTNSGQCAVLLTLSTAFRVLNLVDRRVCANALRDVASVYGIEYSGESEDEEEEGSGSEDLFGDGHVEAMVQQFREMQVEEDIWVIWIGLVVLALRLQNSGRGISDANGANNGAVEILTEWSGFLHAAHGVFVPEGGIEAMSNVGEGEEMDVDVDVAGDEQGEEEEDITTHILSVIAALRSNSPSAPLWSKNIWTRDFITSCASVVQTETITLRVADGSALANGLRDLEGSGGTSSAEQHSPGDVDLVELVALYVGCEMGRSGA